MHLAEKKFLKNAKYFIPNRMTKDMAVLQNKVVRV